MDGHFAPHSLFQAGHGAGSLPMPAAYFRLFLRRFGRTPAQAEALPAGTGITPSKALAVEPDDSVQLWQQLRQLQDLTRVAPASWALDLGPTLQGLGARRARCRHRDRAGPGAGARRARALWPRARAVLPSPGRQGGSASHGLGGAATSPRDRAGPPAQALRVGSSARPSPLSIEENCRSARKRYRGSGHKRRGSPPRPSTQSGNIRSRLFPEVEVRSGGRPDPFLGRPHQPLRQSGSRRQMGRLRLPHLEGGHRRHDWM